MISTTLAPPTSIAIRAGDWSVRLRVRSVVVCAVLGALIVIVSCWSIMVGEFPLSVSDVGRAILGDGGPDAEFIVQTLRLPRALTGVLVGASLGMSGAMLQSLVRNPLGSPDVIGFEQGAAVGAVVVIVVLGGSSVAVAAGAVIGGLATALVVFVLAWKRGLAPGRLVLVGIGVGFTAIAAVDYLITRAELYDVQRAAVWLTGSLNGRNWTHVTTAGIGLAVLAPFALVGHRALDRLALGDDTAAALGVRVNRAKLGLVVVAVLLAALPVAAAGPIMFVAFVAGPIARRLVASPGAAIVPAAFVGALVVAVGDLAARQLLAPTELPVGIMTAAIGGPYLLWLLMRSARSGAL